MKIVCLLCGKELKSTVRHFVCAHGITPEEYYRRYILKAPRPFCLVCGKITKFSFSTGYFKFCSLNCSSSKKAFELDPVRKLNFSLAIKEVWNDPVYRKRRSVEIKKMRNRPVLKAKQSKITKEKWKDKNFRKKLDEKRLEYWLDIENHKHRSEILRQFAKDNPDWVEDLRQKSLAYWNIPGMKAAWSIQMKEMASTKEWQEAAKEAALKKPNNSEVQLEIIVNQLFGANKYIYTGDRTFWIGRKNPDFINKSQKRLIELYGDYWHRDDNPQDRIDYFAQHGWKCIVIWEHELKDVEAVKKRLIEFDNNSVNKSVEI